MKDLSHHIGHVVRKVLRRTDSKLVENQPTIIDKTPLSQRSAKASHNFKRFEKKELLALKKMK